MTNEISSYGPPTTSKKGPPGNVIGPPDGRFGPPGTISSGPPTGG